jgi:hypothetical protein
MPDPLPALPPHPPFTYPELVHLDAAHHQLHVQPLQQLLRRLAALFDYVDDVTLPIPGLGAVVDVLAASPILVAGLLGALEALGRRNARGAVVEVVGSLVEAAVTALPGVEAVDLLTVPTQGRRTATLAREFVEARLAAGTPRAGWWTTTQDDQAYYIEPSGADYIVSHYGPAGNVRATPRVRVRYTNKGPLAVWTPETHQWTPVAADAGQPPMKRP